MACQRAYSIRTRIKTLLPPFDVIFDVNGQRAYSIRTRIKTPYPFFSALSSSCQRAYSIRTRIKTMWVIAFSPFFTCVREHIPLEQGLRPCCDSSICCHLSNVREHIPLEQGLRPNSSWITAWAISSESIFH